MILQDDEDLLDDYKKRRNFQQVFPYVYLHPDDSEIKLLGLVYMKRYHRFFLKVDFSSNSLRPQKSFYHDNSQEFKNVLKIISYSDKFHANQFRLISETNSIHDSKGLGVLNEVLETDLNETSSNTSSTDVSTYSERITFYPENNGNILYYDDFIDMYNPTILVVNKTNPTPTNSNYVPEIDFVLSLKGNFFLAKRNYSTQENRYLISLSSSVLKEITPILFESGLERFLSFYTQQNKSNEFFDLFTSSHLISDYETGLPFDGAHGTYFWELFFHIPVLIADHLNAEQKYEEAKWWYERIFSPIKANGAARYWQFLGFDDQSQTIADILNDGTQIQKYKEEPFNPHTIARLRHGAYKKAVVMKYIDNLLDWGDQLFAKDTMESINEAHQLYIIAQDIWENDPVLSGNAKPFRGKKSRTKTSGIIMSKKGCRSFCTIWNTSFPLLEIRAINSRMMEGRP